MDRNGQMPTITRILWTDYTAFIIVVLLVMNWVIYFAWVPEWRGDGPIMSPLVAPFFLYFSIIVTLGGLGLLVWRVRLFWSVFRYGARVRGRISSVSLRRDRGRVEYTYIYERQEYQSGVDVHRTEQTKALKAGDRVILMVDPSNPERAFIRDLYI